MGFSGGGSNILKSHTHSAAILQDGGNLDFDNVTQGDLSAGDVIYSNGVAMQKLAIGTPAQQLIVNPGATAPVWSSEHTQGRLEVLHDDVLSADGTEMVYTPGASLDMAAVYGELVFCLQGWQASSGSIGLTINGHADYAYNNILNDSGVLSGNQVGSGATTIPIISSVISSNGSQVSVICSIKRSVNGEDQEKFMIDASGGNISQGNQITNAYCGDGFNTGDITELKITASANMDKGMRWTVWGRRVA